MQCYFLLVVVFFFYWLKGISNAFCKSELFSCRPLRHIFEKEAGFQLAYFFSPNTEIQIVLNEHWKQCDNGLMLLEERLL